MSLSTRVHRVFTWAWRRYGKPVMYVVRRMAEWTLPAGFSYDDETDSIHDAAGLWLPNPEDYWVGEYIYIVPSVRGWGTASRTADLEVLIAAGIVPAGTIDVFILHDEVDLMREAHAVEVSGDWYDVLEVSRAPIGIGVEGIWARVRLTRRS
jgi:hypothetical protein